MVVLGLVVVWVLVGLWSSAAMFAYVQREFPTIAEVTRRENARMCLFAVAAGPVGAMATWLMDGFKHGYDWSWWRYL